MKITIEVDLEKDDMNFVGEILRGKVFNQRGGKLGCYSTFELNSGFSSVEKSDKRVKYLWHYLLDLGEIGEIDDYEEEISKTEILENDELIVMYYWDSDGTLLIYHKESGLAFVNYDCKKLYYWCKYYVGV